MLCLWSRGGCIYIPAACGFSFSKKDFWGGLRAGERTRQMRGVVLYVMCGRGNVSSGRRKGTGLDMGRSDNAFETSP